MKNLIKNPLKLIGGLIALVAIIAIIAALLNNAALAPLKAYDAMSYKGKVEKLEKLAPKEYWDWYEEEYDKSVSDLIDDYEENIDDRLDSLEDRYGKNIRTSYKVTNRVNMPKGMVKRIAEALNDKYDIKESSVKAGCYITYDKTIKGSEWISYNTDCEATLIQIGMSWYEVSVSYKGDGEASVSFVID